MKHLFAAIAALATLPLLAQTAPAPAKPAEDPAKKPVAMVNGQTITAADLDMLYDRLGTKASTITLLLRVCRRGASSRACTYKS